MCFTEDSREARSAERSIAEIRHRIGEVRESLIDEIMVSAAERLDPDPGGGGGAAAAESAIRLSLVDKALVEFAPVGDLLEIAAGDSRLSARLSDRIGGGVRTLDRSPQVGIDLDMPWPNAADCVLALDPYRGTADPIRLTRRLYGATARLLVLDTMLHDFPFSGWIQTLSDAPAPASGPRGRMAIELQPTYRGLIDSLYQVGFEAVTEVVPAPSLFAALPYATPYHAHRRAVFVAQKRVP
ncbi:hypothetical protein T8K17_14235 [Thalassobaculum sp. OXR-137]|uniref:hypothetical protein n=1 Tax=Thalassobaculum sp. OXR-137 TaxID=3100173 RepID=UPI002AC8A4F8|nr:hypothetical protein [Thalassobaculum sp. OXR-137]WPZ32399.1 hypothetical protein T8K17_14235 [Thalassobaculum sp. OXR-137]